MLNVGSHPPSRVKMLRRVLWLSHGSVDDRGVCLVIKPWTEGRREQNEQRNHVTWMIDVDDRKKIVDIWVNDVVGSWLLRLGI